MSTHPEVHPHVCKLLLAVLPLVLLSGRASSQSRDHLSPSVREYVTVDTPFVALTHVRVIDGTGSVPMEDQTILIRDSRIERIGRFEDMKIPSGAMVLDLRGRTILPGLVGMHEHMFYPTFVNVTAPEPGGTILRQQSWSFPRLYLACGVTTVRTTGSIEPYADLNLKRLIDEGRAIGPKIQVTAPYLQGHGSEFIQMHELDGPASAREFVNFWADQGATSFKAYTRITRAELSAAIDAAHARGLKVTGHLCSIGFAEAAELGIDDLEHGFAINTDFLPSRQDDVCPLPFVRLLVHFAQARLDSAVVQSLFRTLIDHHVAVTSTLPVLEHYVPNRPPADMRVLNTMSIEARATYLTNKAVSNSHPEYHLEEMLKKEMLLEKEFVDAGGVLLAGSDPTGNGGTLAGFGDLREVELLVEAGFTPTAAIRIATLNGAEFMGLSSEIGTVSAGKAADLVVIRGNPASDIKEIENVEKVFKDGVGYDSAKLIASVRETVGEK